LTKGVTYDTGDFDPLKVDHGCGSLNQLGEEKLRH
jgi:hypothetical protein